MTTNALLWSSPNGLWEIRRSDRGLIRIYRKNERYPIQLNQRELLPQYVCIMLDTITAQEA
jgi:hypothetical protein